MKKLFLFPLLFFSLARAEIIQCKAIKVIDGNNIVCEKDNEEQLKSEPNLISSGKWKKSQKKLTDQELYSLPKIKKVGVFDFPDKAELEGINEGWALVNIKIGSDGRIKNTQVIAVSHPYFTLPVRKQMNESIYTPAQKDGKFIESALQFKIKYKLRNLINSK